jgi:hypothetical protein
MNQKEIIVEVRFNGLWTVDSRLWTILLILILFKLIHDV